MRTWMLAAAMAMAGCGTVRLDSVRQEGAGGSQRLYSRDDSDGRTFALEAAEEEQCRDSREGRWVMALCPEPALLRRGVPARLLFQMEAMTGAKPGPGTLIAVGLRHKGGRNAALTHPAPTVSPVREVSPGRYEATVVFPAEGRWTVEAAVMFPNDEAVRLKFEVVVDGGRGQ